MKKIKVIEFFGEPLNYGGQEAFIFNVYSKIDKSKFEFTFITPFECTNEKLKKMIKENGDHLISDNQKFDSKLRKKSIIKTAKKYINNDYSVIHIHSGSIFTLYNVAKISKKRHVNKVIVHSHATGINNIKYKIIKYISDINIKEYVDYFFACSELAGMWKYPKDIIKSDKFFIIKNGIDINNFKYNYKQRLEYRKKFNLNDEHILIHVGRFSKEKNQLYILDIFNELIKKDENAKLFLIGGIGDLLDDVKSKIKVLNLENKVNILINRTDVNELINMSDVFILPSLWEGLPFTGIEAQANGIPCIFSDTISEEVNISKVYNKLSIQEEPIVWSDKISELFTKKKIDTTNDIREKGFDIKKVCVFLEKIYGDYYD